MYFVATKIFLTNTLECIDKYGIGFCDGLQYMGGCKDAGVYSYCKETCGCGMYMILPYSYFVHKSFFISSDVDKY